MPNGEPGAGGQSGPQSFGRLAGLITFVVGVSTAVSTCSEQEIARHTAFREAVEIEERYWSARFNDYQLAIAEPNEDVKATRIKVLGIQAERLVPEFTEHMLGFFGWSSGDNDDTKINARANLESMKSLLENLTSRPELLPVKAAKANQLLQFEAYDDRKTRSSGRDESGEIKASVQAQTKAEVQNTTSRNQLSYEPQVLSAGLSKGWDVDIFWCGTEASKSNVEVDNYDAARKNAEILARFADSETAISPGLSLGRIRLRYLPFAKQGNGLPEGGSGIQIRYDQNEKREAEVLANTLGGGVVTHASASQTKYYLSLFVCNAVAAKTGESKKP